MAFAVSNRGGIRSVRKFVGSVQNFEDSFAGGYGALHHVIHSREGLDGAEEAPPVGPEHDEHAQGKTVRLVPLSEEKVPPDADHEDVAEEADGAGEGEVKAAR